MEDILQSIKRIIADEGEASPAADVSGVLELTELLAEDTAPRPAAEQPVSRPMSIEEIMAAPISSGVVDEEPAPAPTPAPAPAAPVVAPAPVQAAPAPVAAPAADALMSETTLSASLAALNALSGAPAAVSAPAGLQLRSGLTVEDLVVEALKPLLKEWLDGNLPSLVSALVEKEIRRLGAH